MVSETSYSKQTDRDSPVLKTRGDECQDSANVTDCKSERRSSKEWVTLFQNRNSDADGSVSMLEKGKRGEPLTDEVQVFKRRWFILLIFSLFSMGSAYQWIHMSIISNVVLRVYNDSLPQDSLRRSTAVDWLSMVYFLSYMLAFLPALWILDSKGLRTTALLGTALNLAGAGLKVAAVNSDLFPLLLGAQTLCGLAEVLVLPVPPRLAALWFGADQVSTACSLGVLANQLGVAVGFLLPPVLVPDTPSLDDLVTNFRIMMIGGAVYSLLVVLLVVFAFRDKPPCPPSRAQYLAERSMTSSGRSAAGFVHSLVVYKNSLLRFFTNRNFMLLMVAYGLNTGSFYAISTLLNNVVLSHHPGEQTSAGRIGLTIVLAGVLSSLVAGFWLDKTQTFKATSVVIYALTVVGMLTFTFTLDLELWIIYLTAGSLGFFMTGFLPVGYQFAAEITYPEAEGSSSGLLTASAMIFGIVMTLGMRAMMNQVSILAANIFVCCTLLIGTILTATVQAKYLRQNAEKSIRQQAVELTTSLTERSRDD
ncbi:hypothetical protein ACOMHN_046868 [Nucella lapillus]